MNIKLLQSMFFATAVLSIPMVPQVAQAAEWHQEAAASGCQTFYGSQSSKISTSSATGLKANSPVWVVCSQPKHGFGGETTAHYASIYHAGAAHGSNCYVSKGTFYGSTWVSMNNPVYAGNGYSSKSGVVLGAWGSASIACYLQTNDKMLITAMYN